MHNCEQLQQMRTHLQWLSNAPTFGQEPHGTKENEVLLHAHGIISLRNESDSEGIKA